MTNQFQELTEDVMQKMRRMEKPKFATVTEVTALGLKLNLSAAGEATPKAYKRLASYASPAAGDRVLVEWIGNPQNPDNGTYLVIGKVI